MVGDNGRSQHDELATLAACGKTREWIEAFGQRVRNHFELKRGEDITGVIERLGGRITYQPLPAYRPDDGTIRVRGQRDFEIVLPLHTSAWRDVFTIAHELGHYFLHSNQGERPGKASRSLVGERAEWEANWFAAALLMPADEFRAAMAESPTAEALALRFGVSIDAAAVRLDFLQREAA